MKLDLSPQSWGRVIVSTLAGTALCVAATLYVDSFNFASLNDTARLRAITVDVLLPIVLAVPLLLFFAGKLRELAIAHDRLAIYASTDGLTKVMNRAAFFTLVELHLKRAGNLKRAGDAAACGALLIIDADNFKAVNDRYGHDRGDEALVTIAGTIKSTLRSPDIVGRLGGEEFGVFLPGATSEQAAAVAERIRRSVNEAMFRPAGTAHHLSVSVGGALFDRPVQFHDLFRLADQQLYLAKRTGRNRVAIAPFGDNDNPLPLAMGA